MGYFNLSGKVVIFIKEGAEVFYCGSAYVPHFGVIPWDLLDGFEPGDGIVQTSFGPVPMGQAYFYQNNSLSPRNTQLFISKLSESRREAVEQARSARPNVGVGFTPVADAVPAAYRIMQLQETNGPSTGADLPGMEANGGYKVYAPPID